jgi:hypothetical protein
MFSTSNPIINGTFDRGQLGNLNKEQLPGVEALQVKGNPDNTISNRKFGESVLMKSPEYSGRKDGEVKMILVEDCIEAYQVGI